MTNFETSKLDDRNFILAIIGSHAEAVVHGENDLGKASELQRQRQVSRRGISFKCDVRVGQMMTLTIKKALEAPSTLRMSWVESSSEGPSLTKVDLLSLL